MSETLTAPIAQAPDQFHAFEDLRRLVAGRLHTPADDTWDQARTPWNVHVEQRPMAVLEVRDADDVIAAVRWAGQQGVEVTAQPGGHGANNALEDTLLLRTRGLHGIDVDVHRGTAWVGAGVKAGELLAELDGTGLTFLAGSNPDPTVVGLTITGGISWFGRKYGLGADSIVTVELVDGLGRLRWASADHDPELFWALRGGGGDFGIITRMEVRLHPAPELYGGRLLWPIEQMGAVLRTFARATESAPEELTTWFHAHHFPPLPELPEWMRGKSFAAVAVVFLGTREDAEALLAPYRAIPGLAMDLMGEVALSELGKVAAEPTDPSPGIHRSHLLTHLDDTAIAALIATVGPGSESVLPVVQIRHFGGAFAREVAGTGAHGGVVEPYHVLAIGVPVVPELVEPIRLHLDRVSASVAHLRSGRTLLNFQERGEDPGLWWSPETRARLHRVKRASDPLDLIRSNRPVRP